MTQSPYQILGPGRDWTRYTAANGEVRAYNFLEWPDTKRYEEEILPEYVQAGIANIIEIIPHVGVFYDAPYALLNAEGVINPKQLQDGISKDAAVGVHILHDNALWLPQTSPSDAPEAVVWDAWFSGKQAELLLKNADVVRATGKFPTFKIERCEKEPDYIASDRVDDSGMYVKVSLSAHDLLSNNIHYNTIQGTLTRLAMERTSTQQVRQ